MAEEPKFKTKFLRDDPTDSDAFVGGHEKVAQALAEIIKEEEGGISIGLTGSWGSGKSSVIKMMRRKLEKPQIDEDKLAGKKDVYDPDAHVFEFDAWAHEGDTLRRSFLERLIDFALNEKVLFQDNRIIKYWCKEKQNFRKATTIENSKNKPIVTTTGILFSLFVIFVPILAGYISGIASSDQEEAKWLVFNYLMILGIVFFAYCWFRLKAEEKKEKLNLSFFVNNTETHTSKKTTQDQNPTSVEFEECFKKLIRDILRKDEKRKLVIVIDNMDRMDEENARSIWTTMRTFFDNRTAPWNKQMFLIVPFDSDGIFKMWGQEKDIQSNYDERAPQKVVWKPKNAIVKSFEEKNFQISFHITAPTTSDLQQYLIIELGEAFTIKGEDKDNKQFEKNIQQEEIQKIFHDVSRVFIVDAYQQEKLPTPRSVKVFINNLVALYRQWENKIPLSLQAFYVTKSVNYSWDPEELLVKADMKIFDNSFAVSQRQGDAIKNLAALYFGCGPENAEQILLQRLPAIILSKDYEKISEYAKKPGFNLALMNFLNAYYRDIRSIPGEELLWLFEIVSKHFDEGAIEGYLYSEVKKIMANEGLENVNNWGPIKEGFAVRLKLFMDVLREQESPKDYFQKVVTNLANTKLLDSDLDEFEIQEFVPEPLEEMKMVVNYFRGMSDMSLWNDNYTPDIRPELYLAWIKKLEDSEPQRPQRFYIKYFLANESFEKVWELLAKKGINFTRIHYLFIRAMRREGRLTNTREILIRLIETLTSVSTDYSKFKPKNNIEQLKTLLLLGLKDDDHRFQVVEYSQNNGFYTLFYIAGENGENDSIHAIMILILLFFNLQTRKASMNDSGNKGVFLLNQIIDAALNESFTSPIIENIVNIIKELELTQSFSELDYSNDVDGKIGKLRERILHTFEG